MKKKKLLKREKLRELLEYAGIYDQQDRLITDIFRLLGIKEAV